MREKPTFPEPTPGVPRLSHTRAETYLGCGVRYLFQQETPYRKTTPALARGGGVHVAQGVALLKPHDPHSPAELVESAVEAYDEELRESETDATSLEVDVGRDTTAAATRAWSEQAYPLVNRPELVEKPIVADLGGLELAGVPDYAERVGGEACPRDLKVGRERSQLEANRSRQLTRYGLLVKAATGVLPHRVGLDSLYPTHKGEGWQFKRLWASRTEADYLAQIKTLRAVQRGIEKGVFLPAAEGDWRCSPKWCEFYKQCPHVRRS